MLCSIVVCVRGCFLFFWARDRATTSSVTKRSGFAVHAETQKAPLPEPVFKIWRFRASRTPFPCGHKAKTIESFNRIDLNLFPCGRGLSHTPPHLTVLCLYIYLCKGGMFVGLHDNMSKSMQLVNETDFNFAAAQNEKNCSFAVCLRGTHRHCILPSPVMAAPVRTTAHAENGTVSQKAETCSEFFPSPSPAPCRWKRGSTVGKYCSTALLMPLTHTYTLTHAPKVPYRGERQEEGERIPNTSPGRCPTRFNSSINELVEFTGTGTPPQRYRAQVSLWCDPDHIRSTHLLLVLLILVHYTY